MKMGYKTGCNRNQSTMLPDTVEQYIDDNNATRAIDAFVDSLDMLELGFKYAKVKSTGRPPYDPADMLKLYLYGYLNNIRSSRRLEKEARRNIELIWLLRKLTPDYRTIADFRKDNAISIRNVFKEFTLLCKKLNLFGGELVAIDGTKFHAVNSMKKNFTKGKLEDYINRIDNKISAYMEEINGNDEIEEDSNKLTSEELAEKIKILTDRKKKYEGLKEEMLQNSTTQVSLTDPDSRLMQNNKRNDVCYNTQVTVDSQNKLIIDFEVTNDVADIEQLEPMAKRAKDILDSEELEVLADKGYYNSKQIKECVDNDIVPYIPKPTQVRKGQDPKFSHDKFQYDADKDIFICPAGKELIYISKLKERGKTVKKYRCNDCDKCENKSKCTTQKKGRTVNRWEHQSVIDEMEERIKAAPDKYKQRMMMVEHPFGTIKRAFGFRYLLLKGFDKVRAEVGLTMLSYNFLRVINIMGTEKLIKAIG